MIPLESAQMKIQALQEALTAGLPSYVGELETIRSMLNNDPEILHLLDPEKDLGTIYAAMEKYKGLEMPDAAKKVEKSKLLPPKGAKIDLEMF